MSKKYKFRKGTHFNDNLHGELFDGLHDVALTDNRSTRFMNRIKVLRIDARDMKRGCEGRHVIADRISTLYVNHKHELNARRIARLQAECLIGAEFSDGCRQEVYRLTGRTAAESEGRSALEGLERWLGSWPLRPGRSYLKMLETAREKLTALLARIDEELEKHAPRRSISEESNYRLGGKTMAGGR